MADIELKTITFPGINNRYIIKLTADDVSYFENETYIEGSIGKYLSALSNKIKSVTVETQESGYDEDHNLLTGLTLSTGYISSGGGYVSNPNFSYLNVDVTGITKIKVDGTHHIYTPSQFTAFGTFFDSTDTVVGTISGQYGGEPTSFPYEVPVPDGATKLSLNTDYTASYYPSSLPPGLYVYPWVTIDTYKVPISVLTSEPALLGDISDEGKKIKIIAGVIRNSGNGWEYINDAGHEPLNLTTVNVDSNGRIEIDYGFTASKVLSLVAAPDETFASKYLIGGSVGLDKALFNVYSVPKTYGGLVNITNDVLYTTYSSFSSATLIASTGEIRLYHPSLSSLSASEIFNISASAKYHSVELGSQGNDYISLYLKDADGTIIKTFDSERIYATRVVNSVFINANNIVDAGGNFWIFGVMEI